MPRPRTGVPMSSCGIATHYLSCRSLAATYRSLLPVGRGSACPAISSPDRRTSVYASEHEGISSQLLRQLRFTGHTRLYGQVTINIFQSCPALAGETWDGRQLRLLEFGGTMKGTRHHHVPSPLRVHLGGTWTFLRRTFCMILASWSTPADSGLCIWTLRAPTCRFTSSCLAMR